MSSDKQNIIVDSCDCCAMGWNTPNEFGLCKCWCSKCEKPLSDCQYTCDEEKHICGEDNDDSDEEEEFEYENCSCDKTLDIIIVAGGGMMNGNAYANVEKRNNKYYYVEYGRNPYQKYIGNKIIYDTEDYKFNFNIV